jgi:hypothetical protein
MPMVLTCNYLAIETNETDVVATAAFPESNAFNCVFISSRKLAFISAILTHLGHLDVVNGQKNTVTVTVEKVSDRNVTVTNIAAALLHPDTNTLIKNVRQAQEFGRRMCDTNYLTVDNPKTRDSLTRQIKVGDSICLSQRVSNSDLYLRTAKSTSI